jgi:hypothetical protein
MTLIACRTNSFQDLWFAQIKMTRYEDEKTTAYIDSNLLRLSQRSTTQYETCRPWCLRDSPEAKATITLFAFVSYFTAAFLLSWPFVDPDWQRLFLPFSFLCFFLSDIRFSHSVSTAMMSITNVMILYGHEDVWQQRWWARNWVADVC